MSWYKITCLAKDGQEYLIVMKAVLAPDTYFMVELAPDWSPLVGYENLATRLRDMLSKGETPLLENYGHQVLAAFTEKRIREVWTIANRLESKHCGPQFRLDTMRLWELVGQEWKTCEFKII